MLVTSLFLYALVGAMSTLIFFISFIIFLNYLVFDLYLSTSISYILSSFFNFLLNRKLVFKFYGLKRLHAHLLHYLILSIINYLITIISVFIAVNYFEYSPFIGVLLSIFLTFITGYTFSKYIIYRSTLNSI